MPRTPKITPRISPTPTAEAYGELQCAYDHFNHALFGGELPPCLITLQYKSRRTYGFFAGERFARADGQTTDEIAMNPIYFQSSSIEGVLQTLVHEMTHLWQHHFGRPSRAAYHNRQWAAKMKEIGLHPSHTGQPGGRETGQQMMDYSIEGGRFQQAVQKLLSQNFRVSWYEARLVFDGTGTTPLSGKRVKYTCPQCRANAWGKPDLALICGTCHKSMSSMRKPSVSK